MKERLGAILATAALLAAGFVGGLAAPASAETSVTPYGICAYEYGGRCVTRVTTASTCKNIFKITTDQRKHTACTLFTTQGIVTVWP